MGHGGRSCSLGTHIPSSSPLLCLIFASASMVDCVLFYVVEDSDLFETLCCRSRIRIDSSPLVFSAIMLSLPHLGLCPNQSKPSIMDHPEPRMNKNVEFSVTQIPDE